MTPGPQAPPESDYAINGTVVFGGSEGQDKVQLSIDVNDDGSLQRER